MNKTTLYQLDRKGSKTKVWSCEVRQEADGSATIVVESGQKGGSMVQHLTPITKGKGVGAAATNPYSQAVKEAESKIAKQMGKGYTQNEADAKSSNVLGSGAPKPMLAYVYDPTEEKQKSKNLKNWGILGKTVGLQIKIDGNRCLAHVTQAGTTLYTRAGKSFRPLPHITDALTAAFNKVYDYVNGKYGVTEYWLDGELFSDQASFNTINGIMKKGNPDMFGMQLVESLKYYIYDVILDAPYTTRHKVTQYFNGGPLVRVMYKDVVADESLVHEEFIKALDEGHEGLMIRQLDRPYEKDRTSQLLKYKPLEDDEFEIVGFEESKRGNMVGAIVFKQTSHPNGPVNQTFKAATRGFSHADLTEIWANQSKWIGTKMTVEYFGFSKLGEGGRPRNPKAKGQRVEGDQ